MKKITFKLSVILAFLLNLTSFSCAPSSPANSWLDFFIGKVEIIKPDKSSEPAAVMKKLFQDDTIRTGESSVAYIQIGINVMIKISENAEFRLGTIPEKIDTSESSTELELMKGEASFFCDKLKKEGSFRVKVMTTVVAVRGTIFRVTADKDSVEVVVDNGSVTVRAAEDSSEEIIIPAQKKAVVAEGKAELSGLDEADNEGFRDIRAVRPVPGINCAPSEFMKKYFLWRLGLEDIEPQKSDNKNNGLYNQKKGALNDNPESGMANLGVNRLAANGIDAKEVEDISQKIFAGLSSSKGKDVIFRSKGNDRRGVKRILTGRVSKLGASMIVAVSIADAEKGSVLFNKSVTVRADEKVELSIEAIVKEILLLDAVWK